MKLSSASWLPRSEPLSTHTVVIPSALAGRRFCAMSSTSSPCFGSMPNRSQQQFVAMRVGLWADSCWRECRGGRGSVRATPIASEDPACIGRVAVGEDEARDREAGPAPPQAARRTLDPVERDVVDVLKEVMRIDVTLFHQPGERRAMLVEMVLLDAIALPPHRNRAGGGCRRSSSVDQRETGRLGMGIEAIVEVENESRMWARRGSMSGSRG